MYIKVGGASTVYTKAMPVSEWTPHGCAFSMKFKILIKLLKYKFDGYKLG